MNLIEKLGGYEKAMAFAAKITDKQRNNSVFMDAFNALSDELLEYRRGRDLVIGGDYVVIEDENHIDYGKIYQIKDDDIGSHWIKLVAMRHATDAEIAAGKKLEVNQ